jgi:hypothetical protein
MESDCAAALLVDRASERCYVTRMAALTNAQRQARWRDKRNEDARTLKGTPKQIADRILFELGVKDAARLVRALDKRLRNIKPDCRACNGTGFMTMHTESACGSIRYRDMQIPCDCGETAAEFVAEAEANPIAEREYALDLRKPPLASR